MKKLKKILLIDDDEINNFVNTGILEDLAITERVEIVTDGKFGLEYLLRHSEVPEGICPELVFLDHHMPEMDGLEMMKSLNAINFNQDTVFVLLGINIKEEDIQKFRDLGVKEITGKPLSKEVVMKA